MVVMTVGAEVPFRSWSSSLVPCTTLDDKYEIVRSIGDGSFGSVVLGKTRSAGAHIMRKGTLVAIKTMKKSFTSMSQCNELREIIFLNTLPDHPHLVPAYDIFLDPMTHKLHIAMEHMDGNLYQLIKSRDQKPLEAISVKSILVQILSGLEHIHEYSFFHRDIKPENILVTTSAPDTGSSFKRYSTLATTASGPPTFTVKLADFGLAREMHSRVPYTTYVSTRWYRAPEVLLRAGAYSSPVDIWALGAMAVEIATLKPLFPGSNEVDQVWRVCEIMGSPGVWIDKDNAQIGGGEWKEGVKLAQKLGFSFPKMAPHSLDQVLQAPHWPAELVDFITWCLMWDPNARPTSTQALAHEFFNDAVDPLSRPKSRLLAPKSANVSCADSPDISNGRANKTTSWFKRSITARDITARELLPPLASDTAVIAQPLSPRRPLPVHANTMDVSDLHHSPEPIKLPSRTHGQVQTAAPMTILPSIRPVSPLPDSTPAQASAPRSNSEERITRKIGRQLSMNSRGNHYPETTRNDAERALNGVTRMGSPTGAGKESFFSHLRKRARRFSGRPQAPVSPNADDIEAKAGVEQLPALGPLPCESQIDKPHHPSDDPQFAELDKALESVRYSLEIASHGATTSTNHAQRNSSNLLLKRQHTMPPAADERTSPMPGPISSRTRHSVRPPVRPSERYETPDEEDELVDEALASAQRAVQRLDDSSHPTDQALVAARKAVRRLDGSGTAMDPINARPPIRHVTSDPGSSSAYLTPSPSKDNNRSFFAQAQEYVPSRPMQIARRPLPTQRDSLNPMWPTPPYEEKEWAASVQSSIYAAQAAYR